MDKGDDEFNWCGMKDGVCVVWRRENGQGARCDPNWGRSRGHKGATMLLFNDTYMYVGIIIILSLSLPLLDAKND